MAPVAGGPEPPQPGKPGVAVLPVVDDDAATGTWRYGCERHMRQRRADPERVAYVQLRRPGRRETNPPTDGPGPA